MGIVYGKGRNWSSTANEMERVLKQWLAFSGMTESQFNALISKGPYHIEEIIAENGDRETVLYAGFRPVGSPFVWERNGAIKLEDYHVNLGLLLFVIAGRSKNKNLEEEVRRFVKSLV